MKVRFPQVQRVVIAKDLPVFFTSSFVAVPVIVLYHWFSSRSSGVCANQSENDCVAFELSLFLSIGR